MTQKRLPNDKDIVGYHNLEIIVTGKGSMTFLMVAVNAAFAQNEYYTKAKWHKRFSSDGGRVIAFVMSRDGRVLSDDAIVAVLQSWKGGAWKTTNLKRENPEQNKRSRAIAR